MPEHKRDELEVGELDDKTLETVAGGLEPIGNIDAFGCKDNSTCPNNGCSAGCNPNVVAGCT